MHAYVARISHGKTTRCKRIMLSYINEIGQRTHTNIEAQREREREREREKERDGECGN